MATRGLTRPGSVVAAAIVVSLGLASAPSIAATPSAPTRAPRVPGTNCPLFPADNYWNTRVDDLDVHPRSSAWLANMHPSTHLHPDFGPSFGAQDVPYGIPVTVVHGGDEVPVSFEYADESDAVRYPLSRTTQIEGGWDADGDRHAVVVDASTCTLYETWNTRLTPEGWTAGSGAVWRLTSNRLRPAGWTSADAAGLPILPGLLRWDDVRAGSVAHAIRFTTDTTSRSFVWPARHQAGSTDSADFPPMGARFRLKRTFPVAGYSRHARTILRAMKQYGLVLADNGSAWYFQGAADPGWPASLVEELKAIPASAFEAVDTSPMRLRRGSAQALAATPRR